MTKQSSPCQCHTELLYWIDQTVDAEDAVVDADNPNATPIYGPCGQATFGMFAPGHDAKLKSLLQRLYAAGQEYAFVDGSMLIHTDPMEVARERGWERFLKQHAQIAQTKEARRADKAAAKAARATERQKMRDIKADEREAAKAERIANADERKLAKAMKAKDGQHGAPVEPKAGFYPVRVKVGRWVYDATIVQRVGDLYEVEYKTSKGETKRVNAMAEQIVEGL